MNYFDMLGQSLAIGILMLQFNNCFRMAYQIEAEKKIPSEVQGMQIQA